jgi:type IV pilus assembly protein PilA
MPSRRRCRCLTQAGFTLIELLVVVIIIGLLAAIAIPTFLGQQAKANDTTAKALLRNAAIDMEAGYQANQSYASVTVAQLGAMEPAITFQTTAALASKSQVQVSVNAKGYVLTTTSPSGTTFTYTKDVSASPAVVRACGSGCSW